MKRVIACILMLCMVLSLAGCGNSDGNKSDGNSSEKPSETPVTSDDPKALENIVEEIAVDYGTYGAEAEDRINTLLKNLADADKSAGTRWKEIMDIWQSDKLGQPLHYDVLPDGLPDTDELCIVVLGFQLNPDGTMREELVERLTVALNSAKKYPNAYIVCTGGGTASENEAASEAGEMAKWLIARGIANNRVIVEDNSITTAQNAIFTYDILTSLYPSVKKLAIVSSDYHIATGELLFKAEAILRANAPGNEKLEVIAGAAWKAPSGSLSAMFQAGALIELFGDVETAFDIYYDNYDIHSLPPLH
ncbi:MAG: YdcF family protein [Lachnospiraceae bacterium]|nr:YdcF family protein [Lachnospiraceae bacterium]